MPGTDSADHGEKSVNTGTESGTGDEKSAMRCRRSVVVCTSGANDGEKIVNAGAESDNGDEKSAKRGT
ncbi:MAG: hypothetical protein DI635_06965 [Pseudoxanthomonas suwonensis]|nr:MAG: hypothetical protein DI635_06965 [Pseudoxanthomonas suwonensis]